MTSKGDDSSSRLRDLPQVERLAGALPDEVPHHLRVIAARRAIEQARARIRAGGPSADLAELVRTAEREIALDRRRRLVKVINATGVLLHTNLGRTPLPAEAIGAIERASTSYSNLEYDLEAGLRGSRYVHCTQMLIDLTGAPSALIVNNNAGAVMLVLAAIAAGREVIISRGELIEIGGEFRIPDILAASGSILVEIGTTNRTHLKDYERALGANTAAIMKVHPSNYRVVGFSAEVSPLALSELAHANGVPLIHDLGSGLLRRRVSETELPWLSEEPAVETAISNGADVITFSGDKLLGGPQSGIILGSAAAIDRMKRHPLLRALRVDKMTLAALEATLTLYASGREHELPFWRMALIPAEEIAHRAAVIADSLGGTACKVEITDGHSAAGGGAGANTLIPTSLLEVSPRDRKPEEVIRSLLDEPIPIVARIENDRVVVDLRTVEEDKDSTVADAIRAAL